MWIFTEFYFNRHLRLRQHKWIELPQITPMINRQIYHMTCSIYCWAAWTFRVNLDVGECVSISSRLNQINMLTRSFIRCWYYQFVICHLIYVFIEISLDRYCELWSTRCVCTVKWIWMERSLIMLLRRDINGVKKIAPSPWLIRLNR